MSVNYWPSIIVFICLVLFCVVWIFYRINYTRIYFVSLSSFFRLFNTHTCHRTVNPATSSVKIKLKKGELDCRKLPSERINSRPSSDVYYPSRHISYYLYYILLESINDKWTFTACWPKNSHTHFKTEQNKNVYTYKHTPLRTDVWMWYPQDVCYRVVHQSCRSRGTSVRSQGVVDRFRTGRDVWRLRTSGPWPVSVDERNVHHIMNHVSSTSYL